MAIMTNSVGRGTAGWWLGLREVGRTVMAGRWQSDKARWWTLGRGKMWRKK